MVTPYRRNRPTIGVLAGWQAFAGTLDSFLEHVFGGIRTAAQDYRCNLLVACGMGATRAANLGRPAWPVLFPGVDFVPVGPWNTDGLIVLPPIALEAGVAYFNDLSANGFPIVYAGSREAGPAVIVDNESGILQAMAHLVEHGHRQIAYIAGHDTPVLDDSGQRLAAYQAGVKQWQLVNDPALIVRGYHTVQGGHKAMNEILRRKVPFTAVIASNDESAVGAIAALRAADKRVPQDIAVTGFDDRLEARANIPLLTTVHHPMFEMGYQSLELLLDILHGSGDPQQVISIPTRLVVRASCGCLPGLEAAQTGEPIHRMRVNPGLSKSSQSPELPQPTHSLEETAEKIVNAVYAEIQSLNREELSQICQQLVEAARLSVTVGDPNIFYSALQKALEWTAAHGGELNTWQNAISILRWSGTFWMHPLTSKPISRQFEDMLHQARLEISESARGQYASLLVQQTSLADRIGRMSTRFLIAQKEGEVLDLLTESLPGLGIQRAAVAFFESQGEDPVAWSHLRLPKDFAQNTPRFPSRQFPPEALVSKGQPFQLVLLPLLVQEGPSGFVALETHNLAPCADIVRQLAAALHSASLHQQAVEARRQAEEGRRLAEEANRLKSRFLSIVSHELRTPLNLISGISDILLHDQQPPTAGVGTRKNQDLYKKDLERIYIASQHLDSLIRDVLDLARSDTGQLKLTCETFALDEVLQEAVTIGEQLANDQGLTWRSHIPDHLPRIWADRTRLRQVLLNLVSNAVKFTRQGEVSLSARELPGQVFFQVQDTGLGIPLDEQEIIFDEFRQSERTASRGYGGLGLGLSICKRLVELHGGKIGAHSSGEEGAGSTFYFTLPIRQPTSEPAVPLQSLPGIQHVLLFAKNALHGSILQAHLEQNGIGVQLSLAAPGSSWLKEVEQNPPDAFILDSRLTSDRGWEILKTIKENPAAAHIPVVFYTLEKDGGSLLELDYLTKPLRAVTLAESLISRGFYEKGDAREQSILVVDDEPGILDLHCRMIAEQLPGYQILRASNGREALRILQSVRPALVLLDLMMPELDGFGVLEAMRDNQDLHAIPVIVLTGQALTEEDMERLNHGVAYVLGKGIFTIEETLERITATLKHKHRLGGEAQRVVLKAISYIHRHFSEDISRSHIASYVGLSERHLTRCFHQEMGMTPTTYLNRYRVRQAKLLLDTGERCITDVALEVGFASSGYFTRVFRQEMGLSPRAYLRGDCPEAPQKL